MKNTKKYEDLASKFVEFGKKNGASQVQISINDSSNFSVQCRQGEIERLNDAGNLSLNIKVLLDNKTATANTGDLTESTVENLIKGCIDRAKLTSPDEYAGLPKYEKPNVTDKQLKLYDPKVAEIEPTYFVKFAKEIEAIGLADKRIRNSHGASTSKVYGSRILANSNGFLGSYSYSRLSASLGLQAGEGDNFMEDSWWESIINADDFPSAEFIANTAISRVMRMVGAKKVKTQKVPVVLDPLMSSSLLMGFLSQCISGNAIYMKQSFLVDKLNEKIAEDTVNIIDDGTLPAHQGSQPFDNEGVPSRKVEIIKNGVLKSYLLDTYSARKLNMKSTGHSGGTTNYYMENGTHSPEDIIKSVKNGLYLTNTIGQGTVPTTGDISRGAFGLWIEDGKLTYPVAEITISSNLGELLQDIEMIGNDLTFKRSTNAPTVKLKEMTISGV